MEWKGSQRPTPCIPGLAYPIVKRCPIGIRQQREKRPDSSAHRNGPPLPRRTPRTRTLSAVATHTTHSPRSHPCNACRIRPAAPLHKKSHDSLSMVTYRHVESSQHHLVGESSAVSHRLSYVGGGLGFLMPVSEKLKFYRCLNMNNCAPH